MKIMLKFGKWTVKYVVSRIIQNIHGFIIYYYWREIQLTLLSRYRRNTRRFKQFRTSHWRQRHYWSFSYNGNFFIFLPGGMCMRIISIYVCVFINLYARNTILYSNCWLGDFSCMVASRSVVHVRASVVPTCLVLMRYNKRTGDPSMEYSERERERERFHLYGNA